MVTTRRQEQLMGTPQRHGPAQGASGSAEPSPATPPTAPQLNGGATAEGGTEAQPPKSALKSALKQRRLLVLAHDNDGMLGQGAGGDAAATPNGVGIKKRVRIRSSSNMVHVFQANSGTTDEQPLAEGRPGSGSAGSGSDSDGDTPASWRRRRHAPVVRPDRRSLPRYDQFMAAVFQDMKCGSANGSDNGSGKVGSSSGSSHSGSTRSSFWLGLLFTLCWMFASSALIFVNKQIMVDNGFHFPFALTAMGQLSSTAMALLAAQLGLASLKPPPPARFAFTKLLPVGFSFAASLFLGNASYLGLSVAFINICKASTPMVTLAVGLALRLERPAMGSLLATLLIGLGTAMSTAQEAGSGHFDWLAFIAFATSVVFEGLRVVLTEKLLGQAQYNVMEALAYLGPFTFAFLAVGAFVFEREGLAVRGVELVRERPTDFVLAAAISFLVNLFCYLSIQYVSATSFKVAGCLKNVLVVWGGILQGDVVTARELQGYGISLVGFVLFSWSRLRGIAGHSEDSQQLKKGR